MRTIITLTNNQVEALEKLRQKEHVSRSELIRRAVNDYLNTKETKKGIKLPGFGLWKHKNLDGLDYERQLRKEWDR